MSPTNGTSPFQVYLDDGDRDRLEAWSRRRGWTKSDAIRAAIRALVNATELPDADPLLGASGMIRGLAPDVSAAFDRYLAETFIAQKPTTTRRPKKASRRTKRSTSSRLRR